MNDASGPNVTSQHGNGWATFTDVNGEQVLISSEGVLSAKPNYDSVNEDGEPAVVLVWLKGHRRHVAIRSTWQRFCETLG